MSRELTHFVLKISYYGKTFWCELCWELMNDVKDVNSGPVVTTLG